MKIRLFPQNELFLGLRLGISKIVSKDEMKNYDNKKTYPKMYTIELGLIFVVFEILIKGGK